MISIADLLLPTPGNADERLINDALQRYFTYKTVGDIGGRVLSDGRDSELKDLDIQLKRRELSAMGPQDSDDFNDSPAPKVLGALGITWAKDLAPPRTPTVGNPMSGLRSIFTDAKELGHVTGSIGSGRRRALSRIASALF